MHKSVVIGFLIISNNLFLQSIAPKGEQYSPTIQKILDTRELFDRFIEHYSTYKNAELVGSVLKSVAQKQGISSYSPIFAYGCSVIAGFLARHLTISQLSLFFFHPKEIFDIVAPLLTTLYFASSKSGALSAALLSFLALQALGKIVALYAKQASKKATKD